MNVATIEEVRHLADEMKQAQAEIVHAQSRGLAAYDAIGEIIEPIVCEIVSLGEGGGHQLAVTRCPRPPVSGAWSVRSPLRERGVSDGPEGRVGHLERATAQQGRSAPSPANLRPHQKIQEPARLVSTYQQVPLDVPAVPGSSQLMGHDEPLGHRSPRLIRHVACSRPTWPRPWNRPVAGRGCLCARRPG